MNAILLDIDPLVEITANSLFNLSTVVGDFSAIWCKHFYTI